MPFKKGYIPWNKGMVGLNHSEETKRKISLKHIGMKYPKSFGKKISKSLLGLKKEKCRAWKGGIRIKNGYIFIYMPEHPMSDSIGYIREHRLVMEKKIGRHLHKWEIIHHINGIQNDNRIENLELMTQGNHLKLHRSNNG